MQLVKGAARFCQMPLFWRFIEATTANRIETEQDAADWLRKRCGVTSRAELRINDDARKHFIGVVNEFNDFMRADL